MFSRGEDFPSRFLEIHLSHQRYELEITGIVQNLKTAQVASISPRMPTILLEFKLQSEAVYGYIELKKLLSEHQSINSINLVPISDHNQVTCTFQKHLKFDETSYPLNVTEAVIQGDYRFLSFMMQTIF